VVPGADEASNRRDRTRDDGTLAQLAYRVKGRPRPRLSL